MTPVESRRTNDSSQPLDRSPDREQNFGERTRGTDGNEGNGAGQATAEPVDAIVAMDTHCDGCDHLSDPPDFSCEHSDGRIVALVDRDHVRVRGCPVVENGDHPD
jgi:hypothetical protein